MPKFCPECGENISDKIKFCPSCGANINSYIATIDDNKNKQTPLVNTVENFPSDSSVESIVSNRENEIRNKNTTIQEPVWKKLSILDVILFISLIIALITFVLFGGSFLKGMSGNTQSTGSGPNSPLMQSSQSNQIIPIPTESQKDRNIRIVKGIVEEYHKTHTYSLFDLFVCVDMATDVWDMVKTQGINAKIELGNVDKDVTTLQDANHAWVLAEISHGEWIALETTGGFLVCDNQNICAVNNPRYYKGWSFNTPKELKDVTDKMKHPCSEGYVLGTDNLCHQACGGNTYCTGSSVCINGQCRGCNPGYILGDDLKCHQSCGTTNNYCTGNSVCLNGQCVGCNPGYYLGTDLRCYKS